MVAEGKELIGVIKAPGAVGGVKSKTGKQWSSEERQWWRESENRRASFIGVSCHAVSRDVTRYYNALTMTVMALHGFFRRLTTSS